MGKLLDRLSSTQRQQLAEQPLLDLGLRWVHRALEVEIVDRGMALAAQFLASLIPLLIVAAAVVPFRDDPSFWRALAVWLGLQGASKQTLLQLIGTGGRLTADTSWIAMVILVISGFSFTRALQRAYERVWELGPLGFKNSPRQAIWLGALAAFLSFGVLVRSLTSLVAFMTPLFLVIYVLVGVGMWSLTPYLLLGGRVSLPELVPGAIVSWVALVVFAAASALYMPGRINASAHQFGPIGLIFVILSWYFIMFCIVVAGAALGPVLLESDNVVSRIVRQETGGSSKI